MTLTAMPICKLCAHFRVQTPGGTGTCDAYPDAIPLVVWESEADHRDEVIGDHGIHFQPRDEDALAYAEMLFSADN